MNIYVTSLADISVFRTLYCPKCVVKLLVPKAYVQQIKWYYCFIFTQHTKKVREESKYLCA